MLSQLDHKIFGLESFKELYAMNVDFKDAYENCREGRIWNKYVLQDGLLYRAYKLCSSYFRSPFIFVGSAWRWFDGTF
jgi:hypothetical protein